MAPWGPTRRRYPPPPALGNPDSGVETSPLHPWQTHAGPKSVHTPNSSGVGAANLSWWHLRWGDDGALKRPASSDSLLKPKSPGSLANSNSASTPSPLVSSSHPRGPGRFCQKPAFRRFAASHGWGWELLDFALDMRANLETGQYKHSLPTTKLLGDQMDMAEQGVREKK